MARHLVAASEHLVAIPVVIEILLVATAVAVVDAALLELRRLLVSIGHAFAFRGDLLLTTNAEGSAIRRANLLRPKRAVRMEANALASRNADLAARWARAVPPGNTVLLAASGARDGHNPFVDAAVAAVVLAIADLVARDAARLTRCWRLAPRIGLGGSGGLHGRRGGRRRSVGSQRRWRDGLWPRFQGAVHVGALVVRRDRCAVEVV